MKVLKKIVLGRNLNSSEMNALKGGLDSNINEGEGCECSGSTDSAFWCNDNTNKESGCTCSGNQDNTNKAVDCSCGSSSGVVSSSY